MILRWYAYPTARPLLLRRQGGNGLRSRQLQSERNVEPEHFVTRLQKLPKGATPHPRCKYRHYTVWSRVHQISSYSQLCAPNCTVVGLLLLDMHSVHEIHVDLVRLLCSTERLVATGEPSADGKWDHWPRFCQVRLDFFCVILRVFYLL